MVGTAGSKKAGEYYVEVTMRDRIAQDFTASMRGFNQLTAQIRTMAFAGGALVAGLTAALVPAIKTFADFDDQVRAVAAISGAAEKELGALREEMKRLGATTSFTAIQVGQGMEILARAGLSAQEIITATEDVLNFARAMRTDLATAAQISLGVMNAYRMEIENLGFVMDVLSKTTIKSQQDIFDLGHAFTMVAANARSMGVSLEDTASLIGALADNSIRGTMAGRGLRQMLVTFANTAKQAKIQELIQKPLTDAEGRLRNVTDILIEMDDALQNVGGEVARNAVIFDIFDKVGGTVINTLLANTDRVKELRREFGNVFGTTRALAEAMDAGLGGAFRALRSAIEGVAIELGEAITEVFEPLVRTVVSLLRAVIVFMKENQSLTRILFVAAIAVGALTAALTLLGLTMVLVGAIVNAVTAITGVFTAALSGGVVPAVILATTVIVALVAAFGLLAVALQWNTAVSQRFFKMLGEGFTAFGRRIRALPKLLEQALAYEGLQSMMDLLLLSLQREWLRLQLWLIENEPVILEFFSDLGQKAGELMGAAFNDALIYALKKTAEKLMGPLGFLADKIPLKGSSFLKELGVDPSREGDLQTQLQSTERRIEAARKRFDKYDRFLAKREIARPRPFDTAGEDGVSAGELAGLLPTPRMIGTLSGFVAQRAEEFTPVSDIPSQMLDALQGIETNTGRAADAAENAGPMTSAAIAEAQRMN